MKVATIEKIDERYSNVHFDIERPEVAMLYLGPAILGGIIGGIVVALIVSKS